MCCVEGVRPTAPILRLMLGCCAAASMALAAAGCSSDTSRFESGFGYTRTTVTNDGIVTSSLPVPPEPVYAAAVPSGGAAAYAATDLPSGGAPQSQSYVERAPVRSAAVAPQQAPQSIRQQPAVVPAAYQPASVPAVEPAPASRRRSDTQVVVKKGDTLGSIALRHNVSVSDLMVANGLTSTRLSIGQVLKVPSGDGPRERVAATHTVARGETLYAIAARYGVSTRDLASYNGITRPESLRPGEVLRIPGGVQAAQAQEPASGVRVVRTVTVPLPSDEKPKPVRLAVNDPGPDPNSAPMRTAEPKMPDNDARHSRLDPPEPVSSSGTEFRWPVRGRVISKFGPKPNGKQNDGINIAVPQGTAVKAAENGVVAYAGNELEGYGNLILVRHADGWVSAYAHNSELLVKRGDTVRRGQVIAKAGQTGAVDQPQLHFELRKGSKPVDPLLHMAEM